MPSRFSRRRFFKTGAALAVASRAVIEAPASARPSGHADASPADIPPVKLAQDDTRQAAVVSVRGKETGEKRPLDYKNSVYAGKRYMAVVPDTLDLAERAELAINGIGGTIDPAMHYTQFFLVRYASKPPYMQHHGADTTCDPKYTESFPMMRLMCGSDRYLDIEAAQLAEMLSRIKDGLYWNLVDQARPWRTSYNPAFDGTRRNDVDLANPAGNGRMLRALEGV